jgi:two-component system nitrogen regulation sensor histidine kinase GlnL
MILTIRDQAGVRDLKERMRRSDRLATLGMIAAGIAHEVKNPLVGIRGAAQLMKSELSSEDEPGSAKGTSLIEYLDVILKEADRLNKVLEGILDFHAGKAAGDEDAQYPQYHGPRSAPERGERAAERHHPLAVV